MSKRFVFHNHPFLFKCAHRFQEHEHTATGTSKKMKHEKVVGMPWQIGLGILNERDTLFETVVSLRTVVTSTKRSLQNNFRTRKLWKVVASLPTTSTSTKMSLQNKFRTRKLCSRNQPCHERRESLDLNAVA